jgi:hypothetical protein
MSFAKSLRMVPGLLALVACGGQAGRSELEVYAAESGSPVWSLSLSTERFDVMPTTDPAALRVIASDACGDRFAREYERTTGKLLRKIRLEPSDGAAFPPSFDPPSPCTAGTLRRVTLAPDRKVDVCGGSGISLRDVATGSELFTSPASKYELYDAGLLIGTERDYAWHGYDGTKLWTWPLPTPFTGAMGSDATRVYMLAETGDVYALSTRDGSTAWQASAACGWASLQGELVVCGRITRESECEED